jgi:hypothetical protein
MKMVKEIENKSVGIEVLETLKENFSMAILNREEKRKEMDLEDAQDREKLKAIEIILSDLRQDDNHLLSWKLKTAEQIQNRVTVASITLSGFPTDTANRILFILNEEKQLLRKDKIAALIKKRTGANVDIRPAMRKLIANKKLASVAFNGSKRFTFLALPEWTNELGGVSVVDDEYMPPKGEITFSVETCKIQMGESKNDELELA